MEKEGDSSNPEGLWDTLISLSMKMSNGSGGTQTLKPVPEAHKRRGGQGAGGQRANLVCQPSYLILSALQFLTARVGLSHNCLSPEVAGES